MTPNRPSRLRRRKVFRILGVVMSIIASVIWFSTIATLLLRWGLDDFIQYDSDDGQVAYLSNVCSHFRRGCIIGSSVIATTYILTGIFVKLFYDLVVRQRFRRIASLLFVLCVVISSISLILLAVLDSIHYKRAHYAFLGLFMVFALLAAVLYIIYRVKSNQMNWTLNIFGGIIGLFIPLIITFIVIAAIGGTGERSNLKSVAGSIEWCLALVFTLYFISFTIDLLIYNK